LAAYASQDAAFVIGALVKMASGNGLAGAAAWAVVILAAAAVRRSRYPA
jgi:hypothetical protein